LSFALYYDYANYASGAGGSTVIMSEIPRGRGRMPKEFLDLGVDSSIGDLREK